MSGKAARVVLWQTLKQCWALVALCVLMMRVCAYSSNSRSSIGTGSTRPRLMLWLGRPLRSSTGTPEPGRLVFPRGPPCDPSGTTLQYATSICGRQSPCGRVAYETGAVDLLYQESHPASPARRPSIAMAAIMHPRPLTHPSTPPLGHLLTQQRHAPSVPLLSSCALTGSNQDGASFFFSPFICRPTPHCCSWPGDPRVCAIIVPRPLQCKGPEYPPLCVIPK